jgi:hypothetical protein
MCNETPTPTLTEPITRTCLEPHIIAECLTKEDMKPTLQSCYIVKDDVRFEENVWNFNEVTEPGKNQVIEVLKKMISVILKDTELFLDSNGKNQPFNLLKFHSVSY